FHCDSSRAEFSRVPTDGAPPRRLTHGERDTAPAFSPDGRFIAFLRKGAHDKPQLHVLPTGGGDARELTDLPGGAGPPRWSPDSSRVVFAVRVPADGRYGTGKSGDGETIPSEKESPRRITGLRYRSDGEGFTLDRRSHLFVVDVTAETPAAVQITDGGQDDTDPVWHPDGSRIAFATRRHAGRDDDMVTDIATVGPDGGEVTLLTDTTRWFLDPAWTPDGAAVVAVGLELHDGRWAAVNQALWRIEVGGITRLTGPDTGVVGAPVPVGAGVHFLTENRGAVDLLSVTDDDVTTLSSGHRSLQAIAHAAGVTVVTASDATTAGELFRVDGADLVRLTSFATNGLTVPVTDFTAAAPDGYPVHGFLAVPSGEGPHPVLLMIHGGPFTQYGWTLLDEAQVYAAAGYAVVFGNPRGSSGYGQAHGDHIVGDVGARSAPDLLALLDAALERPDLDGARVGVLGGSHGGFMTTWLIGHEQRFRAAVSERAVNAIDSFEGSSDIGWEFADALYGTDVEARRRQSPLTYADDIETPVLIIHSEQDWRCPVEQAQRLYVALRRRGATAELLLFPGEGHELSRSGLPSHRVARFEAILDWFDRHV
ncbi:MAG: S9 family peptidase, partial [Williamsia herbipolensis]|nr:S9 family peptidase [Williamsia herbipolensis]